MRGLSLSDRGNTTFPTVHLQSDFYHNLVNKLRRIFKDHTGNPPAKGELGVVMETSVLTTSRVTAPEVLGSILHPGSKGITGFAV